MNINIPMPQRVNNKVQGEFYPLQKEELMALRKAKLINNTAYVHLALRFENPFCDRSLKVNPKEFALRWSIPESSVYEAIAKLKKAGFWTNLNYPTPNYSVNAVTSYRKKFYPLQGDK